MFMRSLLLSFMRQKSVKLIHTEKVIYTRRVGFFLPQVLCNFKYSLNYGLIINRNASTQRRVSIAERKDVGWYP